MNLDDILLELRAEATRLDDAILSMDRLQNSRGKRLGRPPKRLTEAARNGSTGGPGQDLPQAINKGNYRRG